jgi:hypothetical protein
MESVPIYRIPYKTVKGVARGSVAKKVPGLKKEWWFVENQPKHESEQVSRQYGN